MRRAGGKCPAVRSAAVSTRPDAASNDNNRTTPPRRGPPASVRPSVRRSFNISSSATAPAMVYRRNFAQARARVIERPAGRNEKPETIVISESDAAAAAAS